jgi:hypothetical protein
MPRVKLFRRENKGAKSRVFPSLPGSKSGRIRAITVEIIILAARITRALTMPVEPSALQNVSGKSDDECGGARSCFTSSTAINCAAHTHIQTKKFPTSGLIHFLFAQTIVG